MIKPDENGNIVLKPEEHMSLLLDSVILQHLEFNGVDNWIGYDEAKREAFKWMKDNGYEI